MYGGKPDWLKVRVSNGAARECVEGILKELSLHTVCEQANCPNMGECFNNRTATFMILGNLCTRNCTFCQVSKGIPEPADPSEPENVAEAVFTLKLRHVVVTSVTRDDLPDGGSGHFARVVESVRKRCPEVTIEVLIPDFKGEFSPLTAVIASRPTVINHNIETIERLYPEVRPMASYSRTLELLSRVKLAAPEIKTKSGIMVGLGESFEEVVDTMRDVRRSGCDFFTIGQYLAPSKAHHPVVEYIHTDVFEKYKAEGLLMGFSHVASGPFIRSSYHAGEALAVDRFK